MTGARGLGRHRPEFIDDVPTGFCECGRTHPHDAQRPAPLVTPTGPRVAREPVTEAACVFVPPHEPWSCSTHPAGYRTGLDQTECSIVLGEGTLEQLGRDIREYGDYRAKQARAEASRAVLAAVREGALERVEPVVTDWFETGYEFGKLDPAVLTERILAALLDTLTETE